MAESTAILVLGMHRSGTSALAGVLHLLGAAMPDDLMAGDQYNEKGYWESKEIADFNDELFKSAGWTWDQIGKFPADWYEKPQCGEFRARAVELLAKRFGQSPLFVPKDPRICLLAPFWISVLEEMKIRSVFVIAARHPREVAASLARRDHFPPEKSELLWLTHLLEAERSTRNQPRCFVSYDRLLEDWRACAARIAKTAGLEWPVSFDSAAEKIDATLSGDLKHHRALMEDLAGVSPWAKSAYEAIQTAAGGDESNLAKTLDDIAAPFDIALAVFSPLIVGSPRGGQSSIDAAIFSELKRLEERDRRMEAERAAIAKIAAESAVHGHAGLDQLVPVSGATRDSDGSWQGSGSPRFLAAVSLPPGKMRIRATIQSTVWSRASVCLDYGRGFIDCESVELAPIFPGENRIDRAVNVYQPASLVRFDPLQDPGEFTLTAFILEHVPASYDEKNAETAEMGQKWTQMKKRLKDLFSSV